MPASSLRPGRAPRRAPSLLAAALSIALLASCGSKVIDLREPQPADPTPFPSTPVLAVQRLAWSWNHRDPEPCEDLYSADFRFESGAADSIPPSAGWFRESELESIENLFVRGYATLPPADHITFLTDGALLDQPSTVPGHDPKWHRVITTEIALGVRTMDGNFAAMGSTRFEVVRGDSARIPQMLRDRGYETDSTRWWIERWFDTPPPSIHENGAVRPAGATPVRYVSIAEIKRIYVGLPPD